MTDYSSTPLVQKLGIKEGHRVCVLGAPRPADKILGPLPRDVRLLTGTRGSLDVILFFATTAAELDKRFDKLAGALSDAGGLWIAWPKKASNVPSELKFESVQGRGLDGGLVDNKSCSIDDTWQALRFVYRIEDRRTRSAP